jgi:ribosomal protein S3
LFFSSIQPIFDKKKTIRESQWHPQKFLRRFFSYGMELESNVRVSCGTAFRMHFIKVNNLYQNCQFIVDLILFFLKKRIPYQRIRNILEYEFKRIPFIKGVRLSYSGRLGGKTNKAVRKKINTIRLGQPSLHIFSTKLDFAQGDVQTKFGMAGVKIWIRYDSEDFRRKKERASMRKKNKRF